MPRVSRRSVVEPRFGEDVWYSAVVHLPIPVAGATPRLPGQLNSPGAPNIRGESRFVQLAVFAAGERWPCLADG